MPGNVVDSDAHRLFDQIARPSGPELTVVGLLYESLSDRVTLGESGFEGFRDSIGGKQIDAGVTQDPIAEACVARPGFRRRIAKCEWNAVN